MKKKNFKFLSYLMGVSIVLFSQLAIPKLFDFVFDVRFLIVLVSVLLCLLLVKFKDTNALAKNAFWMIAILGTAVSLIKPVQYGLDEESHLSHTIGVSDSLVFKYSNENIQDFDQVFKHDVLRNTEAKSKSSWFKVKHKNTMVRGKIAGFDNPSFLPGAIGWKLGSLISPKIYVSYYLGRIFNVLTYALLVFFAISLSKVYRPMIFLMGGLPSALHVIAGFHYDYLYYGASLISVAILTNILGSKTKITVKNGLCFQMLSLLLAFAKFPFVLIGSLLLVFPQTYYDKKNTRGIVALLFASTLFLSLIYSGIIKTIPMVSSITGQSPGLFYFIKHPLPIIRTLLDIPNVVIDHFVSHPLQYITHESSLMMALNILLFVITMFVCSLQWKYKLPIIFQIYCILLLVGISCLMILAITGDPRVYKVGDIMVAGVQGRYYYYMMLIAPIFIGHWTHKFFTIGSLSEADEYRFVAVLQYILVFLNIFTLSVALYTQI